MYHIIICFSSYSPILPLLWEVLVKRLLMEQESETMTVGVSESETMDEVAGVVIEQLQGVLHDFKLINPKRTPTIAHMTLIFPKL